MVADCKLLHFPKDYEKTNRELYLTLNMHLRLHLRECMEKIPAVFMDFGCSASKVIMAF